MNSIFRKESFNLKNPELKIQFFKKRPPYLLLASHLQSVEKQTPATPQIPTLFFKEEEEKVAWKFNFSLSTEY